MTDEKRRLKVFLCHASQDKPVVHELSRRLSGEGWIDPWVDEKKLLPGQDWRLSIEEAVETSDIVIICLSTNSVSKEGHVQKELRYAREIALEKPEEALFLVPVRLDECEVPRGLRFYQWADYFGEKQEETYQALLKSLELRLEQKLRIEAEDAVRKAKETAQRERAEQAAHEQAEREAAEKTAREKDERDSAKITTGVRERAARETAVLAQHDAQPNPAYGKELRKLFLSQKQPPESKPWYQRTEIIIALIGLVGTLCAALIGAKPWEWLPARPAPTLTMVATLPSTAPPTEILPPLATDAPTLTPTIELTPTRRVKPVETATPLPTEMTDVKGVTMRLVPAGPFTMGSDKGADDEKPAHTITLDAFYMDIYEVTNALYKVCVDVGTCKTLGNHGSRTRPSYYSNAQYDNYPVIYVDWNMAKTYCEWRSARLPNEMEWEKAARGTDGRTYPWGEELDKTFANYYKNVGDTTTVGNYDRGKSPYGVCDMAGNVSEWVDGWYDAYPGNTVGDSHFGTNYRVLRGGSWFSFYVCGVCSTRRSYHEPTYDFNDVGFRCTRDP